MREPDIGTVLGKCILDNSIIVEGSGLRSNHATLRGGRWVCGECLIGLLDESVEALTSQQKEARIETEELIRKVKKYGWSVNPETGKLEKL
jgi:hypothetical protein